MSLYTINNYDGTFLANIPDSTLDSTTSLALAGKNYTGYGIYLLENLVYLLQNFSNSVAPTHPVKGQLWFNSATGVLNVYDGTSFHGVASLEQLTANAATTAAQIQSNVNTINTAILSNVAAINANAASQQAYLSSLSANAAIQDTAIASINAKDVSQDGYIYYQGQLIDGHTMAINQKANTDSPQFTGAPTSVTPVFNDRTTRVATTAYVMGQDDARRTYVDTSIAANISFLNGSINTALATKAPLVSPALTGTPTAVTTSVGDRSTKIATTAYVMAQDDVQRLYVDAQITSNISTLNTAVGNNLALKAPLANPAFTGNPTAPTPTFGDEDTSIATTAFVQAAVRGAVTNLSTSLNDQTYAIRVRLDTDEASISSLSSAISLTNSTLASNVSSIQTALSARATIASPTFTGVPAAPTANFGSNSTQLATTAFVQRATVTTVNSLKSIVDNEISSITDRLDIDEFVLSSHTASISALTSALGSNVSLTQASLDAKAPLRAPAFTVWTPPGLPAAYPTTPNISFPDNSTVIANTHFVKLATDNAVATAADYTDSELSTAINSINTSIATKAPSLSPSLSGTPVAPTAAAGTNTTQLATTAFVQTATGTSAKWQGAAKFVSTAAPTSGDGNNGDFWFVYQV